MSTNCIRCGKNRRSHPDLRCETCHEIIALRWLLAQAYSAGHLYADDGEMSDNKVHPFIDFRRDSPEEISRKMVERGKAKLAAQCKHEFANDDGICHECGQDCRGIGGSHV